MKLLYCKTCGDIFNLNLEFKICSCGRSGGKYLEDKITAVYFGEDVELLGFDNLSFVNARISQTYERNGFQGMGWEFTAFFIPKNAKSISRIDSKNSKITDEVKKAIKKLKERKIS